MKKGMRRYSHWLRAFTRGRRARFAVLPSLVLLAVGLAAGPTLWWMWYPPVREFCASQLARLDSSHLVWYLLLLLATLSLAAFIITLIRELVISGRLRRRITQQRMIDTPENLRRLQKRHQFQMPVVCVNEEELYAFCHGLLRPTVIISSGLNQVLSGQELEAVLLHEAAHARRLDPLKMLIARLLARAFFYIPMVHSLHKRYILRLEIAADRAAVDALEVAPLAAALSKMLQGGKGAKAMGATASIANLTEERIHYLLEPHRRLPSLIPPGSEVTATGLLIAGSGVLGGGLVSTLNGLIGSGTLCNLRM